MNVTCATSKYLACLECQRDHSLFTVLAYKVKLTANIIFSFNRIVHWFLKTLNVKLNEFIMYDPNTFYLVNGLLKNTSTVHNDPDVLKYNVWQSEKGMSANELLQKALQKVCYQKTGGTD